jgi:phospholipase/carboxylesterase
MALDFEKHIPESVRPGAPVIVLLHGRGSNRFDLLRLRTGLPSAAIIVAPEAPFPAAPWGYGPGSAWYRYLGEDRPDPVSFEQSQQLLGEFLGRLPSVLPVAPGVLFLGGFSQGGTMSLGHALREPGAVSHVVNFSGFLPVHPKIEVTPETVARTRIFWGHGTDDANIPWGMAQRGREELRKVGADLEARDYPIGHWIDPHELADATDWIERAVRDASARAAAPKNE